jgi:hypothetical protein
MPNFDGRRIMVSEIQNFDPNQNTPPYTVSAIKEEDVQNFEPQPSLNSNCPAQGEIGLWIPNKEFYKEGPLHEQGFSKIRATAHSGRDNWIISDRIADRLENVIVWHTSILEENSEGYFSNGPSNTPHTANHTQQGECFEKASIILGLLPESTHPRVVGVDKYGDVPWAEKEGKGLPFNCHYWVEATVNDELRVIDTMPKNYRNDDAYQAQAEQYNSLKFTAATCQVQDGKVISQST